MTYLILLEDIPLFLDKLSLPDSSSVSDIFTFLDLTVCNGEDNASNKE